MSVMSAMKTVSSADEARGPSASEGCQRSPVGASTMFSLAKLAEGERSESSKRSETSVASLV